MILGTVIVGDRTKYLKPVIERLKELTDKVIIASNTKKDLSKYGKVYDFSNYEWGKEQHKLKQNFLKCIEKEKPEWVLCVDSDELVEATREQIDELTDTDNISYNFYIAQLYGDEGTARVDGYWGEFKNVRLYKWYPNGRYLKTPLHCGLAPTYAYRYPADSGLIVKHYGYMTEGDRKHKKARYDKYDPGGRYKNKSFYESIVSKPKLKPVSEINYKYKPKKPKLNFNPMAKIYYVRNKYGKVYSVDEKLFNEGSYKKMIKDGDLVKVGEEDDIKKEILSEIKKPEPYNENKCDVCGFVAKSKIGLHSHKRKHA